MTPSVIRASGAAIVAALAVAGVVVVRLSLGTTPGYILDGILAFAAAVAIYYASKRSTRARSLRSWHMQRAAALVWVVAAVLLAAAAPAEYAEVARLGAVGCTATAWWLASYAGDVWSRVRLAVDGGIAVCAFFVVAWGRGLSDVWGHTRGGLVGTLALGIPLLTIAAALFAGGVGITEFRHRHRVMPLSRDREPQ